jgi:hypothetical protein
MKLEPDEKRRSACGSAKGSDPGRKGFAPEIIRTAAAILGTLVFTSSYSADTPKAPEPQVTTENVEPAPAASEVQQPAARPVKPRVTTDYVESPLSTAAAKLMDEFSDGDYWVVGTEGQELLKMEPNNNALRLDVAKSLAWTDRYDEAIKQYRMLAGTPLAGKAALGLANVYQWSGRPDLARPLYAQSMIIRPVDPEFAGEAADGLAKVNRALRSRTDLKHINKSDSNTVKQRGYQLDHYWRSENGAVLYGIALRSNRYTMTSAGLATLQHDASISVENQGWALDPTLQLSAQQKPREKGFGSLRIKPLSGADLHLTMGHVNWASMQFEPQGLVMGITANQVGVDGSLVTRLGTINALFNNYQVTDNNRVWEEEFKFFPSWHPLGDDFRYYIGLEGRRARRNVDYYWSPAGGYQSGNIGFEYEVSENRGDYSFHAERGFHVAGEAMLSYDAGLDVRQYVARNWAVLLSGGIFRNQRIGAYHSRYLTIGLEKLW